MNDSANLLPIADRWSYLWLALGAAFSLFSFGQWVTPLGPWLSCLFFLRFMHTQAPLRGFVILSLVGMITPAVHLVWLELVPRSMFPTQMLYGMVIAPGLITGLIYLADRLMAPRLGGLAATLVFPMTATACEFLITTNNPMGTFGALAYTQYGNLPLMQLVSVTGLAGLSFLINWFGASVNWMWDRSFVWPAVRRGVALYGTVLVLVLMYGGARLALQRAPAGSMQVACFTEVDLREEGAALWSLRGNDRAAFREQAGGFHQRYFDETRRQADAGAQLILWPEVAGFCAGEDEAALIDRGRQVAREKEIYIAMPLVVDHERGPLENKLVVVAPDGEVVLEHFKYGGNQFEGSVLGDGVLRTFETPSATVSGVICWDMDFPNVVRQAGRNGTDILLAPAADHRSVAAAHAVMSVFRGIENGVSVVRQADNGVSIVSDPYGRTLATMDHFTASERLMVAQVPVAGVTTVYSVLGDAFGWATVVGFVMLLGWVIVASRRAKRTEMA